MKNESSTAPGAAPYSAPCCGREPRAAPRAVRIPDYSAPCCSQAHSEAVGTAPRAVLISITRRSPFSFVPLHRFGAVAPGYGCTSFQGPRPERRELHGAHPMRPMHPMHHVHQCTRFTNAVRHLARTVRARMYAMRDLVKQIRGIRSETAYALAARRARCRQSHRGAASGYHNLLLAPAERRDK